MSNVTHTTIAKYRISTWCDMNDLDKTLNGIQGNDGNGWQHCHENGKPLIFDKLKDANIKLKKLN